MVMRQLSRVVSYMKTLQTRIHSLVRQENFTPRIPSNDLATTDTLKFSKIDF
jgi:hypothetical protein